MDSVLVREEISQEKIQNIINFTMTINIENEVQVITDFKDSDVSVLIIDDENNIFIRFKNGEYMILPLPYKDEE